MPCLRFKGFDEGFLWQLGSLMKACLGGIVTAHHERSHYGYQR